MIAFIKDFFHRFAHGTLRRKIVTILLIVCYLFLLLMAFVKTNIVVTTPGVINNTAQSANENKGIVPLTIDTTNSSGKIYTIGVYSHYRVSLFQYFLSLLSKDVAISTYDQNNDLSEDEEYLRGVIHKEISINNAIIVAYEEAKKKDPSIVIDKEFLGIKVSAITKQSQSNLKIGDLIIKFNDTVLSDLNQFMTLLNAQNNSDFFSLSVIRNNKEVVIQSRMIALVDEQQNTIYRLGVEALPDYKIIDKFPKYKLNDKIDSIGGSGGAMLALAIYNSLLAEDITMGKTIVGTGTINIDGKIGDIGAVSQKIVTASLFNVDYFFVNPEDYEEAYQKYQTINPSFELVKVNTFQDILIYLEGEKHG